MTDPRIQPRCDYWVRGEFCQQRCGLPATHERMLQGRTLFYCTLHASLVREITRDRFVPVPIASQEENPQNEKEP